MYVRFDMSKIFILQYAYTKEFVFICTILIWDEIISGKKQKPAPKIMLSFEESS